MQDKVWWMPIKKRLYSVHNSVWMFHTINLYNHLIIGPSTLMRKVKINMGLAKSLLTLYIWTMFMWQIWTLRILVWLTPPSGEKNMDCFSNLTKVTHFFLGWGGYCIIATWYSNQSHDMLQILDKIFLLAIAREVHYYILRVGFNLCKKFFFSKCYFFFQGCYWWAT